MARIRYMLMGCFRGQKEWDRGVGKGRAGFFIIQNIPQYTLTLACMLGAQGSLC